MFLLLKSFHIAFLLKIPELETEFRPPRTPVPWVLHSTVSSHHGVSFQAWDLKQENILKKLKDVKDDDEIIRLLYTSIGKCFSVNLKQIPIAWRDGSWGEGVFSAICWEDH